MDSFDIHYCKSTEGQDEFVEELREVCIVQTPKEHLPAFCTGFEFFAELYINVSLEEFVKNVVITGLAWDGIKAVLAKIWKAFLNFVEKTMNPLTSNGFSYALMMQ